MSKPRLPVRPIPIKDESPGGLLIRAAQANGFSSVAALIFAYWPSRSGRSWITASYTDPVRYQLVVSAFGIRTSPDNFPSFSRLGITSESDRIYGGSTYPEKLFRADTTYYCPRCLKEQGFWRKIWMLRPYSACLKHKIQLVNGCHKCGVDLSPIRGTLLECDCGADLRNAKDTPSNVTAIKWWIDTHQKDALKADLADALFLAISSIGDENNNLKSEIFRIEATYEWIQMKTLNPWLLEQVERRSSVLHPRIQLLSCLKSNHPSIVELAEAILLTARQRTQKPGFSKYFGTLTYADAQKALGFRSRRLTTLFNEKRLSPTRTGQIDVMHINNLLFELQTRKPAKGTPIPRTKSMKWAITKIRSGAAVSAGYDPVIGLRSLQIIDQSPPIQQPFDRESWLSVHQATAVLGIKDVNVIGALCRNQKIKFKDRDRENRKRLLISSSDLDRFNRRFIFSTSYAASIGDKKANMSDKLKALGLSPVSAPDIDGTPTFVFNRREVEQLDINLVKDLKSYPTNRGRKPKKLSIKIKASITMVSFQEAADALGISLQKVFLLVREGHLERVRNERAPTIPMLGRHSLSKLIRTLEHKDLITVKEAATRLRINKCALETKWIPAGLLTVTDLAVWRLVSIRDCNKLEKLLKTHVTASEAHIAYKKDRLNLPNLANAGRLNPIFVGTNRRFRLYKRSEIEQLLAESRINRTVSA